jgi:nicotinate-nucleotide adenylyltransferase
MKKIGIMGGTFNPIHNAHLILAECSYEQFNLDKIWIMPSKNPPHKNRKLIENDKHRTQMVLRGINDNPHFELSTVELERNGVTRTSDTLQILCNKFLETSFYFILGEDSLFQIETWHRPDIILKLAHIIVAGRGEHPENQIIEQIEYLKSKYLCRSINKLDSPIIELSSHFIRDNIKKGKSIKYYVPGKVETYIYEHDLYNSFDKKSI